MTLLRTGLGVGDILLATGVLEALARVHRKKFIVETRYPELFLHNPHVAAIWPAERRTELVRKYLDRRLLWRVGSAVNAWFDRRTIKPTYPFPCRNKHLIDAMAESAGVQLLPHERRPFVYLTKEEIEEQRWAKGWIAVQSSSSTYWTPNKNWVPGRMQQVVDALREEGYEVVHLGLPEDEALKGVKDMRGKNTLRTNAAVLANVMLFVGLEGGLVHLARAVNTKSVVIYTHYTLPEETGYAENVNLRAANDDEACWRREACNSCSKYGRTIAVQHVLDAAFQTIEAQQGYGIPLSA
jgi:ADP-heptose:LPS heptosyltransferase